MMKKKKDTPAEILIPESLGMLAGNVKAITPAAMPIGARAKWWCENEFKGQLDVNGFLSKAYNTHLQQLL
jgi:hypothetical protein